MAPKAQTKGKKNALDEDGKTSAGGTKKPDAAATAQDAGSSAPASKKPRLSVDAAKKPSTSKDASENKNPAPAAGRSHAATGKDPIVGNDDNTGAEPAVTATQATEIDDGAADVSPAEVVRGRGRGRGGRGGRGGAGARGGGGGDGAGGGSTRAKSAPAPTRWIENTESFEEKYQNWGAGGVRLADDSSAVGSTALAMGALIQECRASREVDKESNEIAKEANEIARESREEYIKGRKAASWGKLADISYYMSHVSMMEDTGKRKKESNNLEDARKEIKKGQEE